MATSHRAVTPKSLRTGLIATVITLTVAGVVATVAVQRLSGTSSAQPSNRGEATALPAEPDDGAVRIASMNVLAAEHTEADARSNKGSGATQEAPEARLVTQLLDRHGLDVAGVQGLSTAYLTRLEAADSGIGSFPRRQPAAADERAAIVWRTARWSLVRARLDKAKRPGGTVAATPYVLLRNKATKRKVYVINVPAARRELNQPALNGLRLKTELSAGRIPVVMTSQAAEHQQATAKRGKVRITSVPVPFEGVGTADGSPPVAAAQAKLRGRNSSFAFRVASYNVLGSSHTGGRGDRPGRPSGTYRIGLALGIIRANDVDVVGFQEFQDDQINRFNSLTGGSWDVYPGAGPTGADSHNPIGWRTDVWDFVEGHTIAIPYFHGRPVAMPYVLLKHRESGREVWFANFHNPADVSWARNSARFRYAATSREIALANELTATGRPLVLTGDMNQREEYFCRMTTGAPMASASGGSTGTPCAPPPRPRIDWVFGSTPDLDFSDYTVVEGGTARAASDHPMVAATAHVTHEIPAADLNFGDLTLSSPSQEALRPWDPAEQRMRTAYDLLTEASIDVIGFQELRPTQLTTFRELAGDAWRVYPGVEQKQPMQSSIAWKTSAWSLVESKTVPVVGAGSQRGIPYVLLRNNETGERLYVANTYNPVPSADDAGDDWRNKADAAVTELLRTLSNSGLPVVVTGGLSADAKAVCRLDRKVTLTIAGDAAAQEEPCAGDGSPVGDQIVGNGGVRFSNYLVAVGDNVRRATDAPLVIADADLAD